MIGGIIVAEFKFAPAANGGSQWRDYLIRFWNSARVREILVFTGERSAPCLPKSVPIPKYKYDQNLTYSKVFDVS